MHNPDNFRNCYLLRGYFDDNLHWNEMAQILEWRPKPSNCVLLGVNIIQTNGLEAPAASIFRVEFLFLHP
jgi:hypothetical protein